MCKIISINRQHNRLELLDLATGRTSYFKPYQDVCIYHIGDYFKLNRAA